MKMDDDSGDDLALIQEFREALDGDTLNNMRVQSSSSATDLNELFFFVIPTKWFHVVWPYLSSPTNGSSDWKNRIGRIETADLLVRDHEVSDEEAEERNAQEENKKMLLDELRSSCPNKTHDGGTKVNTHHKRPQLRSSLQYGKDYLLLGAATWTFLKTNFGFDQEIKRPVTVVGTGDGRELVAVVEETHQKKVVVPSSGRFEYEALIREHLGDGSPGNVSDDENDVHQGAESEPELGMDVSDTAPANEPVLLLPVSETSTETRAIMRRYGSGLANLGNTCYMNSTLQCLVHTDPIRKYFLSGRFRKDLNCVNPLGTGGELAQHFAQLTAEIWRTKSSVGSQGNSGYSYSSVHASDPQSSSNVLYPRDFKYTVGKNDERFMGYQQHDSQEFATFLLDALHEDTNRVTKKPYIEKPEQEENESDEEASRKAWDMYLQREDSYILENFMAQLKSRLQCNKATCGRVSTTFEPSMFLSVPIPGSSDRTLPVTFVPLDPQARPKNFDVIVNMHATISDLLVKVQERITKGNLAGVVDVVPLEDLAACDVWQNDVHSWHDPSKELSVIRDNDQTVIYQLESLAKIRLIHEQSSKEEDVVDESTLGFRKIKTRHRKFNLDLAVITRLNRKDQWLEEFRRLIQTRMSNPTFDEIDRKPIREQVVFFNKIITFIDTCYNDLEDNESSGQKRGRASDAQGPLNDTVSPDDPPLAAVQERSDCQSLFDVKNMYDVAVLEFIAKQLRRRFLENHSKKKVEYPDGVVIEVRMKKRSSHGYSSNDSHLGSPFVIRISPNMTVFQLREVLARRMSRIIYTATSRTGERTSEGADDVEIANGFGSPSMLCMRQMPLSFEKKKTYTSRYSSGKPLGSVQTSGNGALDGSRPTPMANSNDEEEAKLVADQVGQHGIVNLEWPSELADRYVDVHEYESLEDLDESEEVAKKKEQSISVIDCIEKFCQMEQLEESEMWYCNRCKEHVPAWKQFHIYKAPPILLIHLKRFQFSARSHRRDKISQFIDFPLKDLDLSEHVLSWKDDEKPIYDCYAVSNHYGGLGGGHYTAYALNDDGGWCYYDDSRITTDVDPSEVVSEAAYVLYYRRKDVPVGEDFVMDTTNGDEGPAVIQGERGRDTESSDVSSFAAMGGDDMDVEDDNDATSNGTAPMGSVVDTNDGINMDEFDYDEVTDNGDNDSSQQLPLQ